LDLADNSNTYGGGGMFGDSGSYGAGGLFASGSGNTGGYGGYGNYNNLVTNFGKGGSFIGENGGFGGGGGFPSGNGGFGGGGASKTANNQAGDGGFGAGAPYAGYGGSYSGVPGYGASLNLSAGMGGALFIRSGTLDIQNTSISNSIALATGAAKGQGGALFILHTNSQTNGNNQGMPATLATVTGCGNTFTNNSATNSAGVLNNNNDVFDIGNRMVQGYIVMTSLCPVVQNITVTVGTDDGTGLVENTLSWAIFQANSLLGDQIITLSTNVTFTGVMKRLIDSNMTIQSDKMRRTVDGNSQFRPLFIKSGTVLINNLNINNGKALGGKGTGAGAGMGGSVFIYDGNITLNNLSFNNSNARGQEGDGDNGGGGMYGRTFAGVDLLGGGGLFASSISNNGAYGGYGNYNNTVLDFGKGGDAGSSGGFGGGGSGNGLGVAGIGGNGGFGGGGGHGFTGAGGHGGFGGGRGRGTPRGLPGYAADREDSAGMGGAIFVRTGTVNIINSQFSGNTATRRSGTGNAKGLGGVMFILHSTTNPNGINQGMPSTLATVNTCGLTFSNNTALSNDANGNNTDNIFDLANIINASSGSLSTDACIDDIIFSNGFEN
ncbi:MAG: hypothetical protein L3J53_01025, partial [Proteobacteria bacterium]|nr:hypothetical protein [Pseudomonadota bacterium]